MFQECIWFLRFSAEVGSVIFFSSRIVWDGKTFFPCALRQNEGVFEFFMRLKENQCEVACGVPFQDLIKNAGDLYLNLIFTQFILKETLPSQLGMGISAFREFVVHWDRDFYMDFSYLRGIALSSFHW